MISSRVFLTVVSLTIPLLACSAETTHFEWVSDGEGIYRSVDEVYETGSGRPCFRRIYLPSGIENGDLRGIIVWDAEPHYRPGDPRSTILSEPWRNFASEIGFGMAELATRPLSVEETVVEMDKIFEDMDAIFGRNDCAEALFTFGGTSGTGADTIELSGHRPIAPRMIAGIPCSAGFWEPAQPEFDPDLGVPLLLLPAGRERYRGSRVPDLASQVSDRVSRGLPDTLAVRLGATHPEFRDDDLTGDGNPGKQKISASLELARTWLEAIIELRLPDGDDDLLQEIDPSQGWLGSFVVDPREGNGEEIDRGKGSGAVAREGHILKDLTIAPHAEFDGGIEGADIWLPDEEVAKMWKAYHDTGMVKVEE